MTYDIILGRNQSDKEKFGSKGLVLLGKGYVKMGQYTSLSNKIWMDIARSHVILVAGKRGSGKCLHEDTLITLSNGSQIPIKNLKNNKENIVSLNNNLKIESSEKTEFFSRKVNRLLKIKLRSGKEIKLTPEHPLYTIMGWEEAQSLKVGNRIATPRKIATFGTNSMPKHEIKLISYLLTEGHTKKVVLFANSDEEIVNDFQESLNKFDATLRLIKEKENHYRISSPNWKNKVLSHNNKRNKKGQFTNENKNIYKKRSIRSLIEREKLFGLLSTQKFLSKNILKLNKENLSLFLNRLFSCDGSIYKVNNHWEISYSSSSKKLIKQVQSILIRYGILSKLRYKKVKCKEKIFDTYELVINTSNTIKFIDEIGFFGEKEKKQKIAQTEIPLKIKNPNVDTIPKEIWNFFKPRNWSHIGREMGYKHPKAMRERIHYAPSRQTLLQISEAEQHRGLKLLAESDIFWDEIVSMQILDGKFTVYDICVPDNHNFVANDIFVHNSYSLGVIAEELANLEGEAAKNLAPLIFDTMGIFWTMKYKNEKDKPLLQDWDLKPKNLPAVVFVPFGKEEEYKEKKIPFDKTFALKSSELEAEDWVTLFNLQMTSLPGVLITRAITELKETKKGYTIDNIQDQINKDHHSSKETKEIVSALFFAADSWGIFSQEEEGTKISDLVNPGTTTVLDVSVYSSVGAFNVRALVISLISKKIFESRMTARKKEELESLEQGQDYLSYQQKKKDPLVWIFIDEAHEFLPKTGKTPATDALVQLLREGRQPGVSLVLATQQPGQIHRDVMTQSDIVLSHRITAKPDIEALNEIMQTYLLENIKQQIDNLPSEKGSAIILDDNSERIYPIRVRPRFTWHGGEAPTAVQAEEKI